MTYESVIGLEVHTQLLTRTKVFCGCATTFGAPPNSQTCPVCLGLPGALPVLNEAALRLGVRVALALHCQPAPLMKFDRKNYFYPDLPKNYQISQYDRPLAARGFLEIDVNDQRKRIGITRAHLEEDAGKLLHEGIQGASWVDFNRTGTPLLEIVSEPDLRTPDEAYAYLTELKAILQYIEASNCNMEEGSLRCDANVSIRPAGAKAFGVKVEIKNLNSFKAVKEALAYEARRQEEALAQGQRIMQETRLWDADKRATYPMRSKEAAHDYRYFPEPDLVPFHVDDATVAEVRRTLPELPQHRRARFVSQYGLPAYDAAVLTQEKSLGQFFEAAVNAGAAPKPAANWIMGDLQAHLNARGLSLAAAQIEPAWLAQLVQLVERQTISSKMAKVVFQEMVSTRTAPETIVERRGLRQVTDTAALEQVVDRVIAQEAETVAAYRSGKANALMRLVGQCMQATQGKANPAIVNELLRKRLGKSAGS